MQRRLSALLKCWKVRRIRITAFLLTLLLFVLLFARPPRNAITVAVAKGGKPYSVLAALDLVVDQALARDIVLSSQLLSRTLSTSDVGFLYAFPLGEGELRHWQDQGCPGGECAHVTFYNYDTGGTIEALVNLARRELVAQWAVEDALPSASPYVIPRAIAIASRDERVIEVLGEVRSAEAMMVPMSIWLADSVCSQQWCVDLTYFAPDGSGRVFHTVVNMEDEVVERVFYTRGRADRTYKQPAAQGARYNDGCHEQAGWSVCWEMTAHDGVNFYDASYDGELVFASAKIGQVEVYYPSWPGGYRDEIGLAGSVPPYFGTVIEEFENGFEVSQLFTEFLRWPNCVCCYRYEQSIRFFTDGSFEARFISHGPGCDDLSSYRPFWRIDLAVAGEPTQEVWSWRDAQWNLVSQEFGKQLYREQSSEGAELYTISDDVNYLWKPIPTDPLGVNDGRIFVVQWHEDEGNGPVDTGPADTFWPPGQWLNDESLEDEHVVIWYIPILTTKKSEPYWCMPDPEPDFSPCDAVLLVERSSEIELQATAVPTVDASPSAVVTPSPSPTPVATATPRPIEGEDAETIILNSGCGSCHVIGSLGESGKVGPDLSNIGVDASDRVPNLTAMEYLYQAILSPNEHIAPECPNGPCMSNIMPQDYAARLTDSQIDIIVEFLLQQATEGEPSTPPAVPLPSPIPTLPAPGEREDESEFRAPLAVLVLTLAIVIILMGSVLFAARNGKRK